MLILLFRTCDVNGVCMVNGIDILHFVHDMSVKICNSKCILHKQYIVNYQAY